MTIKQVGIVLALLAIALPAAAVGPVAAGPTTLVVDDDRQQCPNAAFTSITAAITAASPGETIRVCAGLYRETVVVDKASLSLRGSTSGSPTERACGVTTRRILPGTRSSTATCSSRRTASPSRASRSRAPR